MPDYVPSGDDDFDLWARNFVAYITTDPTAPVTTAAQKAALTAAMAVWTPAFSTHNTAQAAAEVASRAKAMARVSTEKVLRGTVGEVQADTATTDVQRTAMKVTVPKARGPIGPVETYPMAQSVDTGTRLRHRIYFVDNETPEKLAKPAGAQYCEIRMQLAGTGPTDPDTMAPLALESRTPHRNDFDEGDEGKMVYYAMRWVNPTGEPGPWGPIFNVTVPG
jgi:hypothetical protein